MSQRTPEEIISNFLSDFVGDNSPKSYWYFDAKAIVNWLKDEGWEIVRIKDGSV